MTAPTDERELFASLLAPDWVNALDPPGDGAVYTPFVVLWLLVSPRLPKGAPLSAAVAEFLTGFPDEAKPDNKRVADGTLSANTAAYSRARSRLDRAAARAVADRVASSLLAPLPPSWGGRRVCVLDGATLQLAPTPELKAAFPPHNGRRPSHWPVMLLVTAHELSSGLAVRPEFGPLDGPSPDSELSLTRRLMPRLPERCILLADSNFGVFACAHAAQASGRDVVFRLSGPRFRCLLRQATPAGPGRWRLTWRPSRWDRRAHPGLPADAAVAGWLHEVQVSDTLTLWLVTTLDVTGSEAADLYGKRWDMEGDIRDIKQTLAMDRLASKGRDTVEKELLAGVVAYNLVNQVRRLAAARAKVEPRRLSFAGVWHLVKAVLQSPAEGVPPEEWRKRFDDLLRWAAQRKLPNRKPGRSYPRTVIPRGRKFPNRKKDAQPSTK